MWAENDTTAPPGLNEKIIIFSPTDLFDLKGHHQVCLLPETQQGRVMYSIPKDNRTKREDNTREKGKKREMKFKWE